MPEARIHIEEASVADALSRAQVLARSVTPQCPVLLYGAALHGEAAVLGAHQHAGHAVQPGGAVLRRRTGGAAVRAGTDVLYLAVGLRDASARMNCPAGRILNRNVRGFLAGARKLGVAAHYFGRDFVSLDSRPGAYVGYAEAVDGRVLLEFFVGLEGSFELSEARDGYPAREEPAWRGKQPIGLREAGATAAPRQILEGLCDGFVSGFGTGALLEVRNEAPSAEELAQSATLAERLAVDPQQTDGLCWAQPREEAIGFVSAGVRLDADGSLAALRLGGDFFQHEGCPDELRAQLLGTRPTPESVARALDAVYAAGPGLIEGVRSLASLQQALLDALELARTAAPR